MQEISSRTAPITQTDKARRGDIVIYWTDYRKAAQQLSWTPQTDLRVGFTRIFDWIRENEKELHERYVK